jgi:predicted alpha/beta superfamily hydrolase
MSATEIDMLSASSGRTYRVQIFCPLLPPPPTGYPVLYVLDGNWTFRLVADQMLVREYTDLTPALVVAIGYPTDDIWAAVRLRMKDLIPDPPTPEFMPAFEQFATPFGATPDDAGGAEAFFEFISRELRPRVASMFSVDASRQVLYGHSLGGLFGLHALFKHTDAFTTYVVSSPSVMYNCRAILEHLPDFGDKVARGEVAAKVLLVVGSLETYPSAAQLAAMSADEAHLQHKLGQAVENTLDLAAKLKAMGAGAGFEVASHVFDGENHMSVVPASLSRALTFAFGMPPPA